MAETEKRNEDFYAKDSFSMRPATKWQVQAITIVAAVVVIALLAYTLL